MSNGNSESHADDPIPPRERRDNMHVITFIWTDDEAEAIARSLENIDVGPDDPLVSVKERLYKITGRDFLLDANGRYVV